MATQQDLESFVTSATCPDDFDSFWDGVRAELAEIPLDATAETDALRSTDTTKVYQAVYRSLGGLEVFAWYAVPAAGDGPFPAILHLPGYKIGAGLETGLGSEGRGGAVGGRQGEIAQQRGIQSRVSWAADQRRGGSRHVQLQGSDRGLRARRGLFALSARGRCRTHLLLAGAARVVA